MSKLLKFVGMDPSYQNWGLCAGTIKLDDIAIKVDDFKTILTRKTKDKKSIRVSSDDLERCRLLSDGVHEYLEEHNPKVIFVEMPIGSQSASAMKGVGTCNGILASIEPFIELTPVDLKKTVKGRISVSKREMIDFVLKKHPYLDFEKAKRGKDRGLVHINNEHCCDSIIAVHAGIESNQFKQLVAML